MSGIDPAIPDSTDPARRQAEKLGELQRRLAALERRWGYEPSIFTGMVVISGTGDVPTGWLGCNGQQITTAWPDLRNALIAAGSPYGAAGGNPLAPDYNTDRRFPRGATTPGGGGGTASHAHDVTILTAGPSDTRRSRPGRGRPSKWRPTITFTAATATLTASRTCRRTETRSTSSRPKRPDRPGGAQASAGLPDSMG